MKLMYLLVLALFLIAAALVIYHYLPHETIQVVDIPATKLKGVMIPLKQ